MHKELADLGKQLSAEKSHSRSFTLPVISVSDDGNRVKVQLCTGTVIEVPASILRGVTPLGALECNGQRKTLAMGWLDHSTDAGKLINQMAAEIQKLARSLQILKARSLTGQSPSVSSSCPTLRGQQVLAPKLVPQDGERTQTAYVKLPVSGRGGEFQLEASWTGPGEAAVRDTAPVGAGCTVIGYSAILPPPNERGMLQIPIGFTFWFEPPA
jgi:hypothetical protein